MRIAANFHEQKKKSKKLAVWAFINYSRSPAKPRALGILISSCKNYTKKKEKCVCVRARVNEKCVNALTKIRLPTKKTTEIHSTMRCV